MALPRRTTPADIARVCKPLLPDTCTVQQIRHNLVWLTEADEPFAEIQLDDPPTLRLSVHCSPTWAAVCAVPLARLLPTMLIIQDGFIQDHRGKILRGVDAEAYWATYHKLKPLLTARFRGPPS